MLSQKRDGKKGRGGHNIKDYLLTADAAKVVMMGDDSEAGLALRWPLVDLLNRIEAGNAELIDYMLRKVQAPEQVSSSARTIWYCGRLWPTIPATG